MTGKLEDFNQFFNGDVRGGFLVNLLYGNDYASPNKNTDALRELMKAENYTNYDSKTQKPNDVHQEFTDLVINTALYHRVVDAPTTAGTNLGKVIERLQQRFDKALQSKYYDMLYGDPEQVTLPKAAGDATFPPFAAEAAGAVADTKAIHAITGMPISAVRAATSSNSGTAVVDIDNANGFTPRSGVATTSGNAWNNVADEDIKADLAITALQVTKAFDAASAGNEVATGAAGNKGGYSDAALNILANKPLSEIILTTLLDRAGAEYLKHGNADGKHNTDFPDGSGTTTNGVITQIIAGGSKFDVEHDKHRFFLFEKMGLVDVKYGTAPTVLGGAAPIAAPNDDQKAKAKEVTNLLETVKTGLNVELRKKLGQRMLDEMIKIVDLFKGQINSITGKNQIKSRSGYITALKTILDNTRGTVEAMLRNSILAGIKEAVMSTYTEQVGASPTPIYTSLKDDKAYDFVKSVYSKWSTLSRDAKNFYRKNIAVFGKKDSLWNSYNLTVRDFTKQKDEFGWIELEEGELENIFGSGKSIESLRPIMRLNLMKADPERTKVLFSSLLPDIEVGAKVWYTDQTGAVNYVKNTNDKLDVLKKIYDTVYECKATASGNAFYKLDGKCTTAGTRTAATAATATDSFGIVVNADVLRDPITDHNQRKLDYGKFIVGLTEAYKKRRQQLPVKPQAPAQDDSLGVYGFLNKKKVVDLAYGITWYYDSDRKEYFRMENGKKEYYDNAKLGDANTCYTLYLKDPQNTGTCRRFIDCLASGDVDSLSRCLDVLQDSNMWVVAKEDIEKVSPKQIVNVLRKFGFKGKKERDATGKEYIVPIPYDRWLVDVVEKLQDQTVKNLIKSGNQHLASYLRALATICRNNPSILNPDYTGPRGSMKIISKRSNPLGLKRYYNPGTQDRNSNAYSHASEMFRSINIDTTPVQNLEKVIKLIMSGALTDVDFFSAYSGRHPMVGGTYGSIGPYLASRLPKQGDKLRVDSNGQIVNGSANMFDSLFVSINQALSDAGLRMTDEDSTRIHNNIKKLKEYEKDLAALFSVLNQLAVHLKSAGIPYDQIDRNNLTELVNLKDVKSYDDLKNFLSCHTREVASAMKDNVSLQTSIAGEILKNIIPRCIDQAAKKVEQPAVSGTQKPAAPQESEYNIDL